MGHLKRCLSILTDAAPTEEVERIADVPTEPPSFFPLRCLLGRKSLANIPTIPVDIRDPVTVAGGMPVEPGNPLTITAPRMQEPFLFNGVDDDWTDSAGTGIIFPPFARALGHWADLLEEYVASGEAGYPGSLLEFLGALDAQINSSDPETILTDRPK